MIAEGDDIEGGQYPDKTIDSEDEDGEEKEGQEWLTKSLASPNSFFSSFHPIVSNMEILSILR